MNWLSLIGVIVSFIGCLFVVSLYLPVLKNAVKFVPGIKKVDSASNLLYQEREPLQGRTTQYLIAEEYGFSNLLNIIKKNKKNISIGQPAAIFVSGTGVRMGTEDIIREQERMPEFKFVFLGYQSRARVPVGYLNIFDEWIKNYKQQFFLKWGFLIITLGFAVSIVSHFYKAQ